MHIDSRSAPLVSIAMTTYNAGDYLHAQLTSVREQNYPNLEIVISDDGSTDGTYEHLLAYAKNDERIRLLEPASSLGMNNNFMRAFAHCRGKLISPCDQDDIWLSDKTASLVKAIIQGGIAYGNSAFMDENGRQIVWFGNRNLQQTHAACSNPDIVGLNIRNCVSGHSMLFDRSILKDMPPVPEYQVYDWWIALWASALKRPIHFVDQELVLYRRHSESYTLRIFGMGITEKTTNISQQYTSAQTIVEAMPDEAANTQMREYLTAYLAAMQHWMTHWFSWRAARFFISHRNRIYRKRALNGTALRKARSWILGYKFKHFFKDGRYPTLPERHHDLVYKAGTVSRKRAEL